MKNLRCPKCNGAMSEGFSLDKAHNAVRVAQWAEGPPSYWMLGILRMKGRRRLAIESWRCDKCGYIEHYAPEVRRPS